MAAQPGPAGADRGGSPGVGPTPRRRLVVLRHGQTDHNASGIWQGQLDTALSEVGRAQAQAAAAVLASYEPSLIHSSDLSRAAETAAALGSRGGPAGPPRRAAARDPRRGVAGDDRRRRRRAVPGGAGGARRGGGPAP